MESVLACGLSLLAPFAYFDLLWQSWKMSQTYLFETSDPYLMNFPLAGMTRNGFAYRLDSLDFPSEEQGFLLLPTLAAREWKDWSRLEVLARLDRGDGVAKRICCLSPEAHSNPRIGGLNPSFAEWMTGFPIGFTDLEA